MCVSYPYYQPERDIPTLRGKVILITGGTTSQGKEVAAQLSQHGKPAQIWIAGRNADGAGAAIAEIRRRVRKEPASVSYEQRASSTGKLFTRLTHASASALPQVKRSFTRAGEAAGTCAADGSDTPVEIDSLRFNRSYVDLTRRSSRSDGIGRSLYGTPIRSTSSSIGLGRDVSEETEVYFLYMDLACLESVKDAATRFLACTDRLDILILNAAEEAAIPGDVTAQGYERHFGTNHLGHALLMKLLMRLLVRTATCDSAGSDVRIVCASSPAHCSTPPEGINFKTLRPKRRTIGRRASVTTGSLQGCHGDGANDMASSTGQQRPKLPAKRRSFSHSSADSVSPRLLYGQSKLANVLYARELAERCPLLTTVSIHPGVTRLNEGRRRSCSRVSGGNSSTNAAFDKFRNLFGPMFGEGQVDDGIKNHLWAATGRGVRSGQCYESVGVPVRPNKSSSVGDDRVLSWKLWEWTQKELAGYTL